MTLALWLALFAPASAVEFRAVRVDETVESIAQDLGDPALAPAIRELNGLAVDGQPAVGSVIELPELGESEVDAGLVLFVRGTGSISRPGEDPIGLAECTPLPAGSSVCTDEGSFATLRLAVELGEKVSYDDVNLLPGTCLLIEATHAREGARSSLLDLTRGAIQIRDAENPGTVTVRTPSGVSTAEGGGFRVTVEDGAARTEALYTEAAVLGAGAETPLDPGQGARVNTGEAPGAAVDLLPPPLLGSPGNGDVLRRPRFDWEPVDRALYYRVSLAQTADFSEVFSFETVPGPEWRPTIFFAPTQGGALWWGVSAFDRAGFQGMPSEVNAASFPAGVQP